MPRRAVVVGLVFVGLLTLTQSIWISLFRDNIAKVQSYKEIELSTIPYLYFLKNSSYCFFLIYGSSSSLTEPVTGQTRHGYIRRG